MSLDCYRQIWWHLSPAFPHSFCLILPLAYLLEGFPSVACCFTGVLPSKYAPLFCSFPSAFSSPSSPRCVFSLFSPPPLVLLPLFDFQRSLFIIPSPSYKDNNFSHNHFSFLLHERMLSVHLRFVQISLKTVSATEPFLLSPDKLSMPCSYLTGTLDWVSYILTALPHNILSDSCWVRGEPEPHCEGHPSLSFLEAFLQSTSCPYHVPTPALWLLSASVSVLSVLCVPW